MSGTTGPVDDRALRLFGVPEEDVEPLCAAQDAVRRDPALAGWVAEAAAALRAAMGEASPGPVLPSREALGGPQGRDGASYAPVVAFAEVLPDLLAHHEALGVAPEVSAATLADVGRMLTRNRRWFGVAGLGDELGGWLTRHLTGAIFQLGRLQYERVHLGQGTGLELGMAGVPVGPGDLVLSVHIPGAGGPLTPEAVDASVAAASTFFRRRFPDERYPVAVCWSWLLDPQLAGLLPPGANLVAFQRRFTLGRALDEDADLTVRKFLWDAPSTPVAELPADSTLRRAMLDLWRRGGHWHSHSGWFPWR